MNSSQDDLIRNSSNWYLSSTLLPIDIVVSAQVQLRYIAAEVTDVFFLQRARVPLDHHSPEQGGGTAMAVQQGGSPQTSGDGAGTGGVSYFPSGYDHPPADVNYEILLRGCNRKLQVWENTWVETVSQGGYIERLCLFFIFFVRRLADHRALGSLRAPC